MSSRPAATKARAKGANNTPDAPSTSTSPPAARTRSKRGEGRQLREEILAAAESIVVETGTVEKVTTRAVAQRVGCSSPSIYLHFPDRASMLFAMCELQFSHLGEALSNAINGIDDPVDRLLETGRAYARFALDHPQQYRTMMMDVIAGVSYDRTLEEMRADLGFDIVVQAITDGIASGALAPTEPLLAAFAIWAHVHGVVSIFIAKPHADWGDPADLIDFALRQGIDGLRSR